MKVKLIAHTQNPEALAYLAARTCYSEISPIVLSTMVFETDQVAKRIEDCIRSGHESVLEHIYLTFAVEGITRACSHQLVRHRLASFSQQSQRYVKYKLNYEQIVQSYEDSDIISLKSQLEPLFVLDNLTDQQIFQCARAFMTYYESVEDGQNPEDARSVLPNCTKTNIVVSVNMREFMHIVGLRTCKRAQAEIQTLFNLMVQEVSLILPFFEKYLVPKCKRLGYCNEANQHPDCDPSMKKEYRLRDYCNTCEESEEC